MDLEAMVGIFADLGDKMDEHNKNMSMMRPAKPIGRTVGGSLVAVTGQLSNVAAQQECPVGKMWEVHLIGIFGNDGHTPVNAANPVPSQPAVPGSTVAQQNLNSYPVQVVISAGTLTAVFVNGIQVGTGDGTYLVPSGGAISITYTVAPTWVWSYAGSQSLATADIFAGSEQDVNTTDFTSIFESGVTIPFIKDFGSRHICAYPGENIYALVTGALTGQNLVIIAVVDEWNWSEREGQHV